MKYADADTREDSVRQASDTPFDVCFDSVTPCCALCGLNKSTAAPEDYVCETCSASAKDSDGR